MDELKLWRRSWQHSQRADSHRNAPRGGGIAVVRLSGAESYAVAARVFHPANPAKKVEQAKGYTALFGHFVDREEAFDEGVALFFRAPHSYTGEDVVELSCHGGSAVARRLVGSLGEIKQTLEFFGIDKDDENNQKRLRDLENGQCLLQDLYGRVGVVQIHPVFEELLHAFDTRPPVQRNEVE